MKLRNLFLAAIVALGMMACNNEEVPQISGAEATVSVKILPSGNGSGLKSVGNVSDLLTLESTVKTLEVWVFKGDALDAYKKANGTEVTDIAAHVGQRDFVVVANAHIGQVNSKTDLLKKVAALPVDGILSGTGLIMTAEPVTVELLPGHNYYGYTEQEVADKTAQEGDKNHLADGRKPLAITRVNARVAIVSAVLDYANVPANEKVVFDALTDVEVAMFNVPNETGLFGTSLAKNAGYQFGAKWASPLNSYVGSADASATANTVLFNEVSDALPVVNTNAPYYYVNESTGTDKMFIVLRAKVKKDGEVVLDMKDLYTDTEGFTYYPVWINKDGLTENGNIGNSNVYRNTQYNITLTIKGLGNPNIDPVENAWLDVQVAVEDWKVVNQGVIWN